MATKKRSETYHEGANDERTAIRQGVKRIAIKYRGSIEAQAALGEVLHFIAKRVERYKKRKGGL
jgi:hypothetical protein